jgi:hypothetical protein
MGEDFGKGVGLWLGGGRLNDYFYTFGRVDYDVK